MQTIIVDMTPGFRMPTIYYSQGDVGTQFAVDLRSRFGDSLPAGATVTIQATKPSGFGFSEAATSVTNGVAVFTTVAGMTDEAGRFAAELKVEASGITLFTANFYMNGEASTHPEGTIDGSEETVIPELTQLVERVETAASSVLDMTVEAETLAAGSQATYSYDEDTNTATFGIPQGEAGAGAAGVTASAYSSSSTYAVGDYVIHNSNLYRCTTAITTAEAFTAAHWTQVVLADDVTDLKSTFTKNIDDFKDGYENLNLWNMVTQLYTDRFVNLVDGHVRYDANAYGIGAYILKVDGNKKYTANDTLRFALPLKADKYTSASQTLLTQVYSVDCSQYDDVEYIAFSLEGYDSVIISEGETAQEGHILPKWAKDSFVCKNNKSSYEKASTASLSDGEGLLLTTRTNLRKGERAVFSTRLVYNNFSAIQFGLNFWTVLGDSYKRNYFVIDSTNISYYELPTSTPIVIPHGLTLANNLSIIAEMNDDATLDLTLISNGALFKTTIQNYVKMAIGAYFVQSVGSTLNIPTLSWTCKDIDKKIWLFGDSYLAYATNRWTYYLTEYGYANNVLIDGFPGESGENADFGIENLVRHGTPKYAVWFIGMNDGTDADNSTPNADWVTRKNKFLEVCEANSITPIFATIPSVPSINHKGKNAWIRSSGYRYIDMAKAVGADITTSWYWGMLASDNVHPTELGAKALFSQVLLDFPEIMVDNFG